MGKGTGDLYIKVFSSDRIIVSEIYEVEDCWKYDNALSDNTSKYDTTSANGTTFAYDSTETAYKLTRTSDGFGAILVKDLTVDTNVEISADIKLTSSNNNQPRLSLYNGNNGVGGRLAKWSGGNDIAICTFTKTADGSTLQSQNTSLNWGTYYTVKITFNGSTVTEKVYQGDTLLNTVTATQSVLSNSNNVGIEHVFRNGAIAHFKNLKIKEL